MSHKPKDHGLHGDVRPALLQESYTAHLEDEKNKAEVVADTPLPPARGLEHALTFDPRRDLSAHAPTITEAYEAAHPELRGIAPRPDSAADAVNTDRAQRNGTQER